MAGKCKIMVTNITSDDLVEMAGGISLHHIVCDHTVESSGHTEKQRLMICSCAEYDSIIKNGYYEVDDLDCGVNDA